LADRTPLVTVLSTRPHGCPNGTPPSFSAARLIAEHGNVERALDADLSEAERILAQAACSVIVLSLVSGRGLAPSSILCPLPRRPERQVGGAQPLRSQRGRDRRRWKRISDLVTRRDAVVLVAWLGARRHSSARAVPGA
jgi:hypothetical protein